MIGADVSNLQRLIAWANNQRVAQTPNGVILGAVTAQIGPDKQPVTLTWNDSYLLSDGTVLPGDWEIMTR